MKKLRYLLINDLKKEAYKKFKSLLYSVKKKNVESFECIYFFFPFLYLTKMEYKIKLTITFFIPLFN